MDGGTSSVCWRPPVSHGLPSGTSRSWWTSLWEPHAAPFMRGGPAPTWVRTRLRGRLGSPKTEAGCDPTWPPLTSDPEPPGNTGAVWLGSRGTRPPFLSHEPRPHELYDKGTGQRLATGTPPARKGEENNVKAYKPAPIHVLKRQQRELASGGAETPQASRRRRAWGCARRTPWRLQGEEDQALQRRAMPAQEGRRC